MEITLVQGDITEQRVDAVVNAANSSLRASHCGKGPNGVEEARFVLFGAEAYQAFDSVRREWGEGRGLGHGSMVD